MSLIKFKVTDKKDIYIESEKIVSVMENASGGTYIYLAVGYESEACIINEPLKDVLSKIPNRK